MKKIYLFLFSLLFALNMNAQQTAAYKLFNNKGEEIPFSKMMEKLIQTDVVFIGEYHNNPISHWFELEITKALFEAHSTHLVLGAEMFEADNQLILTEYLEGFIGTKNFEQEAKLWNNYKTDYKPLVEFAKQNNLNFVATNIPRRYAAYVHQNGGLPALDSLSNAAKNYIAPLPVSFDESVYMKMFMGMGMQSATHSAAKGKTMNKKKGPSMKDIAQAQAIKDATMAWFIAQSMDEKSKFVHYNGSMHSDRHQGIITYLNKYNSKLSVLSVTTVEQADVNKLNEAAKAKADFIICVDSDMTKTY